MNKLNDIDNLWVMGKFYNFDVTTYEWRPKTQAVTCLQESHAVTYENEFCKCKIFADSSSAYNNIRGILIDDLKNNRTYSMGSVDNQAQDAIELDVLADLEYKLTEISQGRAYDTNVSIELDLEYDLLSRLYAMAHEKNLTIDEVILQSIIDLINKLKSENNELVKSL